MKRLYSESPLSQSKHCNRRITTSCSHNKWSLLIMIHVCNCSPHSEGILNASARGTEWVSESVSECVLHMATYALMCITWSAYTLVEMHSCMHLVASHRVHETCEYYYAGNKIYVHNYFTRNRGWKDSTSTRLKRSFFIKVLTDALPFHG